MEQVSKKSFQFACNKSRYFISFLLFLNFSTSSLAAVSKDELSSNISKAEKEATKCNDQLEQIKTLDKKFDTANTFPSKKVSLQVLKKLDQFPGTPSATQALMRALVTTQDSRLDYNWLATAMDKTLVCDPMLLNQVLTKLVRSSRAFRYSSAEKKLMSKTVVNLMKKETGAPTHLGMLAPYILILDALVEQQALKLNIKSAIERTELKHELNQGLSLLKDREDSLKDNVNNRVFQTKNFVSEVRANERVREKFRDFLNRL